VILRTALLAACLLTAHHARAAEDYCGYGHGTAVLLIDRTTAFDGTDKALFLQALDGVIAGLGPGDRLAAFTMSSAYTESRKIFDRCNPACPEEGFFAGLVSTCRPVVARSDKLGFTRELAQTLAGLLQSPEETRFSDLFRTVAEAVRPYVQGLRTVILFSDLIENSALLPERDLKRLPPPDILQRLKSNGVQGEFAGASVRVFGFGRDDAPGRPPLPQAQRQRISETWRNWFKAGGAGTVEIGFR
jgi:hypothetical protein